MDKLVKEETVAYRLGQIDARLDENDRVHTLILTSLTKIECGIDKLENGRSQNAIDIAAIKGKASVWGSIAGLFASALLTAIGWVISHVWK